MAVVIQVKYSSRMKEIGISPEDKVICFGQLFGMCDYITFPLGKYFFNLLIIDILNKFQ